MLVACRINLTCIINQVTPDLNFSSYKLRQEFTQNSIVEIDFHCNLNYSTVEETKIGNILCFSTFMTQASF